MMNQHLIKGNESINVNDYKQAVIHYQSYLDVSKTLGKYRNFEAESDVNRKIAYAYSTSGQYGKTINCLNEARLLDSIDNNEVAFAEDIRLLGMANVYSNNYDQALTFLLETLALTNGFDKSIKETKQQVIADIYLSLSKIYATIGDYEMSNMYIHKAVPVFENINSLIGKTQAYQHLAWLQIEDGNYSGAKHNLSLSVENANKLKIHTFEQENSLGDISEKEGKYEEALRFRLSALAQADSSKILPQIVWSYIKVGDTYKLLGAVEKALRYYMRALELNKTISKSNLSPVIDYQTGNQIGAFRSFSRNGINYGIGISALKIGEMIKKEYPDSALFYYNKALEVFKKLHNKEPLYLAYLSMGDLCLDKGKAQEALEILLPISQETSNSEILWQTSFLIAKAYDNIGNDSLAIAYYKNSVGIIEKIRRTIVMEEFRDSYFSNKVVVYDMLVQLLQKEGKTSEAWAYTEKARARNFLDMIEGQKIGIPQDVDSSLIKKAQRLQTEIHNLIKTEYEVNMGEDSTRAVSRLLNKNLKDKQEEYNQVLEELEAKKSRYLQLVSAETIELKQLQQKINDDQVLVEYWCGSDSLLIYVITKDSIKITSVGYTSNQISNKIINFRKTLTLSEADVMASLKDLYNILWKPIEQLLPEDKRVIVIPHQYLHYVPFAALVKGNEFLVEKYLISNSVSASLFKNKVPSHSEDLFFGVALNQSNVNVWDFQEKSGAKTFLDMMEKQRTANSQIAALSSINNGQRLQTEICNLLKSEYLAGTDYNKTRSTSSMLNINLKAQQEEYNQIKVQIESIMSRYHQLTSSPTIELKQLQQKMTDNQALVEYWCGSDSLLIYVITKDTLKTTTVNYTNNQLKNKVIKFGKSLTLSENDILLSLKDLYNTLWEPIEHYIPDNKEIGIVPHQYLHYVPFAALVKDNKYMAEKYKISNSVFASLYKEEDLSELDGFFEVDQNHTNSKTLNSLAYAEQEIRLIQQYFSNSTISIGDQLSESLVKEVMPKASIIHFATHGFYNEQDPMGSFLLLNSDSQNDGLLTALDIFNSSFEAKLTTLSACQTSIGKVSKGDEINSLNRAFLYAGSSNVISTLWNINDRTTPALMDDFYALYKQGYNFVDALCLAQRKFIKRTNSNPILWSAFILYN
jgi:CHAT domain-containing protein